MEQSQENQNAKVCKCCRVKRPLSEYSVKSRHGEKEYLSCYCDGCANSIRESYYRDKRIRERPELYFECASDECYYAWAKTRGTFCARCGNKGSSLGKFTMTEIGHKGKLNEPSA